MYSLRYIFDVSPVMLLLRYISCGASLMHRPCIACNACGASAPPESASHAPLINRLLSVCSTNWYLFPSQPVSASIEPIISTKTAICQLKKSLFRVFCATILLRPGNTSHFHTIRGLPYRWQTPHHSPPQTCEVARQR